MRQYCQGVYWEKMCLNQITTEKKLPSGTRWRTAAAGSSSCSNSSIETHHTPASRYTRIHTRTSCSSEQYNNYNRSGPGTLLWKRTRCLQNKKERNKNTQSCISSACSTLYVHKTGFSIAQTTLRSSSMIVHIFTLEQKKTSCTGREPRTPRSRA